MRGRTASNGPGRSSSLPVTAGIGDLYVPRLLSTSVRFLMHKPSATGRNRGSERLGHCPVTKLARQRKGRAVNAGGLTGTRLLLCSQGSFQEGSDAGA